MENRWIQKDCFLFFSIPSISFTFPYPKAPVEDCRKVFYIIGHWQHHTTGTWTVLSQSCFPNNARCLGTPCNISLPPALSEVLQGMASNSICWIPLLTFLIWVRCRLTYTGQSLSENGKLSITTELKWNCFLYIWAFQFSECIVPDYSAL